MTNQKSTKRALLLSALSLLMCVSMLIGSTYAWFTDSVTSAGNKIMAGTLDVELLDANGDSLEGQMIEWAAFDGRDQDKIFWEPGCTYKTEPFTVKNAGNLALKFNLIVNGITGNAKLLEVIYFTCIAKNVTYTQNFGGYDMIVTGDADLLSGEFVLEPDQSIEGIVLTGHMDEDAGNEYQDLTIENISISVVATQVPFEQDSSNGIYDENATYPDVAVVNNSDDLVAALTAGSDVVLADDIELTSTLMAEKDVVIDLNGNTITTSSNCMFQSQSNAASNMTITSSVAGAEINVSGGDTSVLLGYGSTVISNVTINVEGCDNSSPNPFKVYGDLTLGEGTVVNVDYLGTSLISNNGAHAIAINGAQINVGTFKTNGTAIITLNNASTLEIKNTDIKIDNFVRSPFGGDSLVSKVDGVTIEDCTFDVTDSNGTKCTFVAKDGKYRLVQK